MTSTAGREDGKMSDSLLKRKLMLTTNMFTKQRFLLKPSCVIIQVDVIVSKTQTLYNGVENILILSRSDGDPWRRNNFENVKNSFDTLF